MNRHLRRTVLAALVLAGAAQAHAESALIARATDLLAQAFSDAAALVSLPAESKVEVLRRNGAWSEVKTAAGQTGWVRMTALKFGDGARRSEQPANALGALNNLLSAGRTSNTATVTTGVRGLDAEDLQRAQANPEELKKLEKFVADNNAAQLYARRAKLAANKLDYLPDSADGGNKSRAGGQ